MIIIVTGVPGVGKTTVLNEFLKLKPEFELKNFADSMLDVAIEKGILKGKKENLHDELRKLPTETQLNLQKNAGKALGELGKKKNIVIDTHAMIKTPKGYFAGLPIWVLENLKPNFLILVEVKADTIAKRRAEDPLRVRDQDITVEGIQEHLDMCRAAGASYSAITGCFVKIVENKQNAANEAAKEIAELVK
jgi:adenylate kinase